MYGQQNINKFSTVNNGRATRYGLDGPWIESRWGDKFFRTAPDRPWGPPSLL